MCTSTVKKKPGPRERIDVPETASNTIPHASDWCPRAPTLVRHNPKTNEYELIPLRCKTYNCHVCGPKRIAHNRFKILKGAPSHLITLTTRPTPGSDRKAAYTFYRKALSRMIRSIRKNFGDFEAAIILEWTKKGAPHWHLAARCRFIPHAWLSKRWHELTGNFIVDIRRIAAASDAVRYLTKYLTKQMATHPTARIGRPIAFTKGYKLQKFELTARTEWNQVLLNCSIPTTLSYWPSGFRIFEVEQTLVLKPKRADTPAPDLLLLFSERVLHVTQGQLFPFTTPPPT